MIFDYLQAYFWAVTYVFVILYGVKRKVSAIPSIAVAFNLAWEINAFIRDILNGSFNEGFWIHLAWLSLDIVIFAIYLFICKASLLPKWLSVGLLIVSTTGLYFVFAYLKYGMLISAFLIDLVMAILWVLYAHNKILVPDWILIMVGVSKLLGDCFAWIYCMNEHWSVLVMGIVILALNAYCLAVFIYRYFKRDAKQIDS